MYILSDKAKVIVSGFSLSKPIVTIYDSNMSSGGKLESKNPKHYEIYLNPKVLSQDNFDYFYLHEFYHAVQDTNKFPVIVCGKSKRNFQLIASILTSLVLDLNLDSYLNPRGFSHLISEWKDMICQEEAEFKNYLVNKIKEDNAIKVIYHGYCITLLYFQYSKSEALELNKSLINCCPDIHFCATRLIQIIESENYVSRNNCANVFDRIVNEILNPFGLGEEYCVRKFALK